MAPPGVEANSTATPIGPKLSSRIVALKLFAVVATITLAGGGAAAAAGALPEPVQKLADAAATAAGLEPEVEVVETTTTSTTLLITTVPNRAEDTPTTAVPTPNPGPPATDSTTTTCVPEPGDDSCTHRNRGKSGDHSDDSAGNQSGKNKTVPSAVPEQSKSGNDDSGKGKSGRGRGSDDSVTTIPGVSTSTTIEDHQSGKDRAKSEDD